MIQKNESQTTWLDYLNTLPKRKTFFAQDKQGDEVMLEATITNLLSPEFAGLLQSVWEIGVDAYLPVEMDFLKAFPEVATQEPQFKQFGPLFAQGTDSVDWDAVGQKMKAQLKQHFVFDPASFSDQMKKMFADDIAIFVSVKEKGTQQILGLVAFSIRTNFNVWQIKVTHLAVGPTAQKRGLATLLMSSIFTIVPKVKSLFLCTRITNKPAQRAYSSWSFERDLNPKQDPHYKFNLDHWIFMEYDADKTDRLQKKANSLKTK